MGKLSKRSKLYLIILLLALPLAASACIVSPDDLQQEAEEQVKNIFEQLFDSAKDWVVDTSQDIWQDITDGAEDTLQTAQEYLGLEVPELCGMLAYGVATDTSEAQILALFQAAWKDAGGARVIGWPVETVHMDSSSSRNVLYQHFEGGTQERSILLFEDGRDHVYLVPGEWLRTFEGLGGLKAGYPTADIQDYDADFWKLWWKDDYQTYTGAQEFVLMKPGDVVQVMVIPALFWQEYKKIDGLHKLGAALSSLPLDEEAAIDALSSSTDFSEVVNRWALTSFRLQAFEKGSLIYNKTSRTFRLVERERLSGGDTNLALSIGPILMRERLNVTGDPCLTATMRNAGVLATSTAVGDLIVQIAFSPAKAAVMVSGWTAETLGAKLFYELVGLILAGITDENMIAETAETVGGTVLDSLYAKVIGDTISGPAVDLTITVVESGYEKLQTDRLSYSLKTTSDDLQMTLNYDPWTHNAWGVVTSQCTDKGDVSFLYIMELEPSGVYVEGTLHYYDLYNDGAEIR